MTTFYLNDLEKWLHQNKAEMTGDYIEGCLLDNFVVTTKRGTAAIYESFVNKWSSRYYVEFAPANAAEIVWDNWEKFAASATAYVSKF